MSRHCHTCQHLKRPEIDRRLAAGEPAAQIARDYELNPSSLYRHRVNCLKPGSSNAIMKETARRRPKPRGSLSVAMTSVLPLRSRCPAPSGELPRRVSDEYAVPLCRGHHREVHRCGDEPVWWLKVRINPMVKARELWRKTHPLPIDRGERPAAD